MKRTVLIVVGCLLMTQIAFARGPYRDIEHPGKSHIATKPVADGWYRSQYFPKWVYLAHNRIVICGYNYWTSEFRWYNADTATWSKPTTPPWLDPKSDRVVYNGGVNTGKLNGSQHPVYRINGNVVTRSAVIAAIMAGLKDDSGKWRLTVVARDKQLLSRVRHDLENDASLAELRKKVLVQYYDDPKHYHLQPFKLDQDDRFRQSGFAIFLQKPCDANATSSPVVEARYEYRGPEALREIDPDYDPNQVPNQRSKPLKISNLSMKQLALLAALAVAGVMLFLAVRQHAAAKPTIKTGPQVPQQVIRPGVQRPSREVREDWLITTLEQMLKELEKQAKEEQEEEKFKTKRDWLRETLSQLKNLNEAK